MWSQAQGELAPANAVLRVYLLGPPRADWAGGTLPLSRRQARALLYRLATRLEPVPREHLCFLFWPDTPECDARRKLTHLLTHLRHALPEPDLLLIADDRVALDAARVWCDVVAFRQGTEEGTAEGLRYAVELYRGAFLAGFSLPGSPEYEGWATQEQRACESLYLRALATLVDERTASGDLDAAIMYAKRYLETDDLAEDIHRRLMELYAATGDRHAALRQFERCIAALERELNVGPLPETREVYEAIMVGQPPRHTPRPKLTALPRMDTPMLGRQDAVRHLEEAYRRAFTGPGQVVLISGEAGVGKSRLLHEFASRLSKQTRVLIGSGHPETRSMPYHPIIQALRTLFTETAEMSGGEVKSGSPTRVRPHPVSLTWLAEISRLLPELRSLYPDMPPPLPAQPEEARSRLFDALSIVMRGLSPLVLCLDDLHHADSTTLDWLVHLGRHLGGSRLLVIGTYRSEESDAVRGLRHNLALTGALQELQLEGLDEDAVLKLLRRLAGTIPGDEAFARRLRRITGGNPFFVLETIRSLMQTGRIREALADADNLALPETVVQAVDDRLRRLSPVARQVLQAAAILGDTFGLDPVRLIAGRPELETMDSLDELVAQRLLEESRGAPEASPYCFHHELVRRVVYASLAPMRRQLLHRRAGRALEQLEPTAATVLAHHFEAGGELRKALQYHALAARQAADMFAWNETEEHQTRILALLDRLDPDRTSPDSLAQRGQVLADRAHLRYVSGRLDERDADLEALAALAEASGDSNLRLLATLHRTRYLNLAGRYVEAISQARATLQHIAPVPVPAPEPAKSMLCQILVEVGFAHYLLGQPRQGLAALESALAIAGEKAGPEIRGPIAHNLGYIFLHMGDYAQALAYQEEAEACHRAAGDYNGVAWALLDIGLLHLKLGHFAEAQRHLSDSLALAQRIGARPAEAYARTYTAYWELYQGFYAIAAEHLREGVPMHLEMHQAHGAAAAEIGLGLALYHLGSNAEARRVLQSAVQRARAVSHQRRLAEALIALGLVILEDGQTRSAHGLVAEAIDIARESECREHLAAGFAILARAERLADNLVGALACAREAIRLAGEGALPVCQMWGETEAGLTLLAQGEAAAALQHTERAVALVHLAHEAWIGSEEVYRAHARVLRALGRPKEAHEHARRAKTIIAAKAGHISDPQQSLAYLRLAKRKA